MRRRHGSHRPFARLLTVAAAAAACGGIGLVAWLAGCARNDPFDPGAVAKLEARAKSIAMKKRALTLHLEALIEKASAVD